MNEAAFPALPDAPLATSERLTTQGAYRAVFATIAVASVAVLFTAFSDLPVWSARVWLGIGMVVVCGLPLIKFVAYPERRYLLLPLIALAYMVGYGFPSFKEVFVPPTGEDPVPDSAYLYGCQMCLLGCTTLVAGMLMPVPSWVSTRALNWPSDEKLMPGRFAIMAVIGGILRVFIEAAIIPEAVTQPALIVASMSEVGAFIVFTLWMQKKASPIWCFVALAGVLPTLFVGFGSSKLWNVVQPLLIFVVGYYGVKRRVPWRALTLMTVLFIPANLAKHEFRYQLEQHPVGVLQRPLLFAKVIWEGYTENTIRFDDAGEVASGRMDHISLMAVVVSMTPDRIPYWEGESYKTLLYAPIPRFIMPDKPRKTLGQEFGHRYKFINDEDYMTSVNFAQMVETYTNFGTLGVAIGMFLIGLFYAFVSALLEDKNAPLVKIAVGAHVALGLLNIESDFALIIGGVVMLLPSQWLAMHIMCWNVRHDPESR